ncbi:MAG: sterol desaturase family protein [Pseudomonadota bacterium]
MSDSNQERNKFWNYHPQLPLKFAPYYDRSFDLKASLIYAIKTWHPFNTQFLFLPLALVVWFYFTPSLERAAEFRFDWMFEIWLRNMVLITAIVTPLHLWLHTFNKQEKDLRYDKADLGEKDKRFLFGDQLYDNVFLTLTSGVLFWTLWESFMLWAYANGVATLITFESNPIWFIALLLFIPYWAIFFFDLQHRIMHSEFLYKHVHSWHHKNGSTGPWSGLAMHPVEHFVLMMDNILYLIVASHPIHVIYNLMFHGIGAPTSHVGFESLKIGKHFRINMGDFYHQIHHRFFDINFGAERSPLDKWQDTFHDGTNEGHKRFLQRRKEIRRARAKTV